MEESKKKPVMIGFIIVCFAVAGAITYFTRSPDDTGIPEEWEKELIWVTCRNPQCKAQYQMSRKEHAESIENYMIENPGVSWEMAVPAIVCKDCGEESVYQATKCAKCGLVFEVGLKRGDFADRCPDPKCGYSQTEEDRKKAAAARGGGGAKGTPPE